ncbi:hypothetical protein [Liquorilactobacillus sucicola]|uniref:hypothetical protein n=1 Tax=Liquorilactobacillus sucicola TaxID=519050 RepID=UPI00070556F2|nr:hypothetical protein [Liquorilactobacillus sucicola]
MKIASILECIPKKYTPKKDNPDIRDYFWSISRHGKQAALDCWNILQMSKTFVERTKKRETDLDFKKFDLVDPNCVMSFVVAFNNYYLIKDPQKIAKNPRGLPSLTWLNELPDDDLKKVIKNVLANVVNINIDEDQADELMKHRNLSGAKSFVKEVTEIQKAGGLVDKKVDYIKKVRPFQEKPVNYLYRSILLTWMIHCVKDAAGQKLHNYKWPEDYLGIKGEYAIDYSEVYEDAKVNVTRAWKRRMCNEKNRRPELHCLLKRANPRIVGKILGETFFPTYETPRIKELSDEINDLVDKIPGEIIAVRQKLKVKNRVDLSENNGEKPLEIIQELNVIKEHIKLVEEANQRIEKFKQEFDIE